MLRVTKFQLGVHLVELDLALALSEVCRDPLTDLCDGEYYFVGPVPLND